MKQGNEKWRRFLSVSLAACMCLTAVPVSAAAEDVPIVIDEDPTSVLSEAEAETAPQADESDAADIVEIVEAEAYAAETEWSEAETAAAETELSETEDFAPELELVDESVAVQDLNAGGISISTATSVILDRIYSGTITSINRKEYYKVVLPATGRLSITTTARFHGIRNCVYDSTATPIWDKEVKNANSSGQSIIGESLDLNKGTYYFSVEQLNDGQVGNYSFRLSFDVVDESFVETGAGTNNTIDTANELEFGKKYYGQIGLQDMIDYYKIVLPSSGRLTLNTNAKFNGVRSYIYDENRSYVWDAYERANSANQSIINRSIDLTKGTYYISVERLSSETGTYTITCNFASAKESFAETGRGTDNTIETANAVKFNKEYRGQIGHLDNIDFFKFDLPSSGRLALNTNAKFSGVQDYLYDADGNKVWDASQYANTAGQSIIDKTLDLTKGTYYLSVGNCSNETGNYTLSLKFTDAEESFPETGKGTNNSLESAENASVNTTYTGQIGLQDDVDYYKMTFRSARKAAIQLQAKFNGVQLRVYKEDGTQLLQRYAYVNAGEKSIISEETKLEAGIYYFAVEKLSSETGTYTLLVESDNLDEITVSLKSASNVSNGIKLTWDAVSVAERYRVYRKAGNRSYETIANVTGTTFTDKTAVGGNKYTYYVCAVRKEQLSSYKAKSIICLKAPTITLSNILSGVQLKWNKSAGAKGYYVYRKAAGESYKKIATVQGAGTLTYKDTAAVSGTAYTYAVRSFNGSTKSVYKAKNIVRLDAPTLTLKNQTNGVRLKWTKTEGAAGYYIYRKSDSGKFSKIGTVKNGSTVVYNDRSKADGVKYTYAVRSYKNAYTSYYRAKSIQR